MAKAENNNIEFTKKVYGKKQFQHSLNGEMLPSGFIDYHKKNFSFYFNLNESEFNGLRVLDTGCGPGKHAAVLALMGADVLATDLSEENLKKGEKLKTEYKLDNLNFLEYNLKEPLSGYGTFDLVSTHNWIQHAENPSQVMRNLVDVMKIGSRIYFSCYLGGTFRFFIAQIARSILRQEDYEVMEKLVRYHFPRGFNEFNNYLDIYMENIFDDFFVPYCHTTSYDILCADSEKLGLKPITKVEPSNNLHAVDNIPLRIGFDKTVQTDYKGELDFSKPLDEFQADIPVIQQSVKLARKAISKFQNEKNRYLACSFCLGLYRLRAEMNSLKDTAKRHKSLRFYLDLSLSDSNWAISFYNR